MKEPINPRSGKSGQTEERPADPGPTTGGMGSAGSQPDEPSLEEKPGVNRINEDRTMLENPGYAARRGIAGFHHGPDADLQPEGDGGPSSPAGMRLDADSDGRVNTGTGDQPGNTGGSRTGTPQEPDTTAPQAPDNVGSNGADPDHERAGGMSGGPGTSN